MAVVRASEEMTAGSRDFLRPPRSPAGRAGQRISPAAAQTEASRNAFVIALFLLAVILPIRIRLGELMLSADRIFLLVAFVPLLIGLLSRRAGSLRGIDLCMALYSLWIGLAIFMVHGAARIPFIGITIVEMFGGYLVGRILVRGQADYRVVFRYFVLLLVFLLPFVLIEQFTRRALLNEILGAAFETLPYVDYGTRLGLNRIQATFEHPILYGMFCSIGIANLFYLNRDNIAKALSLSGFSLFMTFAALSSAPLLSGILQVGMIIWDKLTKGNWKLLAALAVAAYVTVDLLSNRSPVAVFIHYLTFNAQTGYWRLLIWEYGMQNVWANPVFGLGLNDWVRPSWMHTPSVDNFWLLTAMRYGIPAVVFLMVGIALGLWSILRRQDLSAEDAQVRNAYVVSAVGLFFTLCTVFVWGSTAVFVMFYIGAGVWLAEAGRVPEKLSAAEKRQAGKARPARNAARTPVGARGQPSDRSRADTADVPGAETGNMSARKTVPATRPREVDVRPAAERNPARRNPLRPNGT
jgi:hypothetical protein